MPGDDCQLDLLAVAAVREVVDGAEGGEVPQPPADGQYERPAGLRRCGGGE
ncbi:hypothetical protein ACVB8X_43305 [Streptomyces sp. NRAIS4]